MGTSKTRFEILTKSFFSEARHQKRSLEDVNEYFDNVLSGKKIGSKSNREFLEGPLYYMDNLMKLNFL